METRIQKLNEKNVNILEKFQQLDEISQKQKEDRNSRNLPP